MLELGNGVLSRAKVINTLFAHQDPKALVIRNIEGSKLVGVVLEEFCVFLLFIEFSIEKETVSRTDMSATIDREERSPCLEKDFIIIFFIYVFALHKTHSAKIVGRRLTYFVF